MNIVEFKNVSLGYGNNTVLKGLEFGIKKGERLGILGPNGSGKTTLLKGLLGLLNPFRGEIMRQEGLKTGYVKQDHSIETLYPFTVFEVVLMGFEPVSLFSAIGARKRFAEKVREALEFVRMFEHKDELFRTLSGGQKQRVLIARALAGVPALLVLDEPVSDLDAEGVSEITGLLNSIHSGNGVTVVIVSHLLEVMLENIDRLLIVKDNSAELSSRDEVLRDDIFAKLYRR